MQARLRWPAALVFVTSCSGDATETSRAPSGTLILVREKTFEQLLGASGHYEASGVVFSEGMLHVVFDDSTRVADVDLELRAADLGPGAVSHSNYEGITVATRPAPRTYVVKEIGEGGRGTILTLDGRRNVVAAEPTDISFRADHGLEGIAWLDDIERLLALCEENSCGAGDRSPGHGVLHSLRHESGAWVTERTIALPTAADFEDYSDVAVRPEDDGTYRIAVLSQRSAALWVGTLRSRPLAVAGPGVVYDFPRAAGIVQYCAVEGVSFIDRTTLAIASDRDKECRKSEALHIFAIPRDAARSR